MHTIEVNEKSIRTNLNESYSFTDGNSKKTMKMHIKKDFCETDNQMFDRLVDYGYTTITFYYCTTRIKGLYDIVAYCRKKKTSNKMYTFILVLKDGTKCPFYCQKNELKKYMTIEEIEQQDYIFILNDGFDKTQHKPFKIR